ncbi:hypothetical protein Q6U65_003277 [Vibrio parahaemolyticus]|nr:hypothetical protein [Vibrio parahaemolyticus]
MEGEKLMSGLQHEVALIELIDELVHQPFVIGQTDCNMVALKVLKHLAGIDWYDRLYNRYKTYAGGARVAKKETGYSNILHAFNELDCLEQIPLEHATVGDIIVIREKHFSSCVIHLGQQVLMASHMTNKIELGHVDYDEIKAQVHKVYRVK